MPSSRTTLVSPARDTRSPATRPAPLQLPPQTLPGVPGGRPCSPALEARFTRPGAPVTPFCIRCRDQRSCHSWPGSPLACQLWCGRLGVISGIRPPGESPVHSYNRPCDATVDPLRRNRARLRQSRPQASGSLATGRRRHPRQFSAFRRLDYTHTYVIDNRMGTERSVTRKPVRGNGPRRVRSRETRA